MKYFFLVIIFCNVYFFNNAFAQKYELPAKPTLDTSKMPNILDKKQYFGFEYNNSWTSLSFGNQVEPFFFKPSLGGHFVYNRFFTKNFGFGIGLGFQQRGAGIYYEQEDGGGDSTTRFRLRLNTWELPLQFLWRGGFIGKNQLTRWTGSVGVIPNYNFETNRVFVETGGGQHVRENQSKNFYRFDALVSVSFGLDFSVSDYSLLRLQAYGNVGLLNVYRNELSEFSGHNTLFGIKVGFLF